MAILEDPLHLVVGDKAAKPLDRALELRTVGDLLRHYPRRYETRGELTDLASLRDGEYVTVQAEIATVTSRPMRGRRGSIFEATVTDGHGLLVLTFFARGRQDWREKQLTPGTRGLFSGQVSTFRGKRQLAHPDYELLDEGDDAAHAAAEYAAQMIPVYPAAKEITSWQIARSVRVVLDVLDIEDPVPRAIRDRHGLCGLADALRGIHRPIDRADVRRATKRLKWDEAFLLQVVLAQRRLAATAYSATPRPRAAGGLLDAYDARLPFELTVGQDLAGATIGDELALDHPMHRLLQGEVGSGKTVIAVRAMLQVVDAGGQAALLAPTEVLAQQHFRSITEQLGPLAQAGELGGAEHATRVALLTGSLGAAARRRALLEAASGTAGIVIGTHALLEEQVQFADLGLVVIDEQHRFGVEQRDALRDKAGDGRPHVLVMTATPIPRTVAMTVFGDLEMSTLTELPAGRSPIATHVVPAAEKPHYLERVWERLREEAGRGRQCYVVCPRIGGGGPGDGRAGRGGPAGRTAGTTVAAGRRGRRRRAAADRRPRSRGGAGARAAGRAAPRGPARPAAADEKDAGDAGVRGRVGGRAGHDHRGRGRRGRAERHRHGHHGCRPVRGLPAAPAARPGRPGQPRGTVPAGHRGRGGRQVAAAARRGGRHRWTGSSCPGSISSSAGRATCSAPPRRGAGRA